MKKEEKNYTLHEGNVLTFALWLTISCLTGVIITIAIYYYNGYINYSGKVDTAVIGTFGDFIGGFFGTLFSLVTVFFVWLAYQSQKEELKVLANQGKEQIEIQALSALIVHYENRIKNLSSNLGIANEMKDDSEEHKQHINQILSNIVSVSSLLEFSVNELTNKIESVKLYSKEFEESSKL